MKADSHPGTIRERGDEVSRSLDAVRALVRAMRLNSRDIELTVGISLAQLFVLQQIAERSPESLNDLAERTATHQSSVSVVLRRLTNRGLVSRRSSSVDKRRVQVVVTPAGQDLLNRAPRTIQKRLITSMESFSSTERDQLADLLERWLISAGVSLTNPPMMDEEEDAD